MGAILAPPIVATWFCFGWQSAFAFVGSRDCVAAVLVAHVSHAGGGARRARDDLPRAGCCGTRFVWSFTVAKIFLDPVWYFYIFWFPEYLKNTRDFDLAAIGNIRGFLLWWRAPAISWAAGSGHLLRRG